MPNLKSLYRTIQKQNLNLATNAHGASFIFFIAKVQLHFQSDII